MEEEGRVADSLELVLLISKKARLGLVCLSGE